MISGRCEGEAPVKGLLWVPQGFRLLCMCITITGPSSSISPCAFEGLTIKGSLTSSSYRQTLTCIFYYSICPSCAHGSMGAKRLFYPPELNPNTSVPGYRMAISAKLGCIIGSSNPYIYHLRSISRKMACWVKSQPMYMGNARKKALQIQCVNVAASLYTSAPSFPLWTIQSIQYTSMFTYALTHISKLFLLPHRPIWPKPQMGKPYLTY